MNISAYLRRLNYTAPLKPTYKTLCGLHLAHLYAIPFENLDIHHQRPIVLELDHLFDKIVTRQRGGFCYELNGLFAWLLREIGFSVTLLSARGANKDGTFGPEFDHLALLVNNQWLADVGWGETFRQPLLVHTPLEQPQPGWVYWLEELGHERLLWQRDINSLAERQYLFTLEPRTYEQFFPMCEYHQTSPNSMFTRKRVCTLATPTGRVTLDSGRFITTTNGVRQEQPVTDEATYHHLLQTHFGVVL